ncbi:MAG TPA: ABC transporter permease, partial [Candidatus Rokubacteria bacterium]|nr:ABC transporter permease [Candidatus Rokubacteria bacterium]
MRLTRRTFLAGTGAGAVGVAMGPWVLRSWAQGAPIKIGIVLPYTGVYAVLGESITQAMELVFE